MYNRYIQSDRGSYIPLSAEPPFQSQHKTPDSDDAMSGTEKTSRRNGTSLEGLKSLWETLSGRFHLDTGDLLLLAMLYFLYREDADEELLIALGLLFFL